jgi:uncharacterized protein YjbI with pentapeptide repeats
MRALRFQLVRPGLGAEPIDDPERFTAPAGVWWARPEGLASSADAVTRVLEQRGRLDRLALRGLNDAGASALIGAPLRALQARDAALSDLGFLDGMPLEQLDLTGATLTGVPLAVPTSLTRLDLSNAGIEDPQLRALAGLRALAHLDLSGGPGLTDAGLTALRGLALEHLALRGRFQVLGHGLAGQTRLRSLDLSGTALRHDALELLRDCPLERLVLARTPLLDLERIRVALQQRADHDLEARMALAEGWADRFEFRFDEGYGEPFHVEAPEPADPDDPGPIEMLSAEDWQDTHPDGHDRARRLLESAGVFDVDVVALAGGLSGLRALADLPLVKLDLNTCPLEHVPPLPASLRVLTLSDTRVRDLSGLPAGLRGLDVSGLHATGLPPLPELEALRWGRAPMTRTQLPALPRLHSLDLHLCEATPRGLERLPTLPALHQLTLHGSDLSQVDLSPLGRCDALRVVDLTRCTLGAGVAALAGCGRVQHLVLNKSDVDDAGAQALFGLTQLQVLVISFTRVTQACADALRAALPNTQVRWAPLPGGDGT